MNKNNVGRYCALAVAVSCAGFSQTAMSQSSNTALEEVIVTAQKREQGYLDVPVSVATLSGEILDVAKVNEFQDLVQVTPSLTYSQTGDQRGVGILMRGIGTTAFQTAVEPTVSTVVDGITMGRTVQFVSDLDDIERVEVLRGPQGTLFGKNASGGLVAIHTKNPTDEFEGRVRATMADDDAFSISAMVSGPLSDNVRGRLSVYSKTFDGWLKNAYTGNTINGDESFGARGKLAIDLSDSSSLMLIADVSNQDRNCCAQVLTSGNAAVVAEYAAYGVTLDRKNDVTLDNEDGFSNTDTWGVSAQYDRDFDNWRFVSVTGYRGFTLESQQGVDGRPYNLENAGPGFLFFSNGATTSDLDLPSPMPGGDQEQTQLSQEFRLESTGWENTDLTLGLFYWNQSVERYFERVAKFSGVGPFYGWLDSDVDTTSWAVFGQMDHRLSENLSLIAGLRYTDDEVEVDYDKVTPSPGPAISPGSEGSSSTTESNVSGKLGLQYTPSDEWTYFATVSTGYKAPAFDLIFNVTPETIENPVPEETVTSLELGVKGVFWDGRARLGATLFDSEFKDLQGQGLTPDGLGFQLISAGKAVTQGLEVDLALKPTANWLLNMGFAYTDATYDEYRGAQCYPGQSEAQGCVGGVQDLSGQQIANAPKRKFTLQTRYDLASTGSMVPYVGASYRRQSDSPSDLNGDPRTNRPGYGILNLNAGVVAADGKWQLEVFVKNATDRFYNDRVGWFGFQASGIAYNARDAWRYMGVQGSIQF